MIDRSALGASGRGLEMSQAQLPAMVLTVTPAMIQYAELLAMGMNEIEGLVAAEVEQNPALEVAETPRCPACAARLAGSVCVACWGTAAPRHGPATAPAPYGFEPPAREVPSILRDALVELDHDERRIAEYVLGNLSPRGLLDLSAGQVAADLGVSPADVTAVVAHLHEAAPGIAAESLEACLLGQLDALADCEPEDRDLCRAVIAGHLGALARGQTIAVARRLGVPPARIEDVRTLMRTRLRPPAGLPSGQDPIPFVTPDVVVVLEGDDLIVEIVERHRFPLVVDDAFKRAAASGNGSERASNSAIELADRARSFIERLRGRWRTLQTIAEATVLHQEAFVRHGPQALRPLTRARLASAIGVHESTVSRATRGKYVMLPDRSLVPFARFFDAATAPKEALRRILARGEARSDAQLARALEEQGFCMARRTVAKYRRQLGFASLHSR